MTGIFGNQFFRSWSSIFLGATVFAILFELPVLLVDYLLEGAFVWSRSAVVLAMGMFVGYLLVGGAIKIADRQSD